MKLIIGEYENGTLSPGYSDLGDDVPSHTLQELKGRFSAEYREANLRLTAIQLLAAATPDQDLIQAVHSLSGIDTALNTLGKYLGEWHGLHQPLDTATWQETLTKTDERPGLATMRTAAQTLLSKREDLLAYINSQAKTIMPNTSTVVGTQLAAKLLSEAGSLERLARLPSSTVQLLGAERALFRHLRDRRSKPPKHGVLISHELVQTAAQGRRGKAARVLANAASIAAKVDYGKGTFIGDALKKKAEVQLGLARP